MISLAKSSRCTATSLTSFEWALPNSILPFRECLIMTVIAAITKGAKKHLSAKEVALLPNPSNPKLICNPHGSQRNPYCYKIDGHLCAFCRLLTVLCCTPFPYSVQYPNGASCGQVLYFCISSKPALPLSDLATFQCELGPE